MSLPTISVFLASSLDELRDDRMKVAADFTGLTNMYLDNNVALVRMTRAEVVDDRFVKGGKQGRLNGSIRDSDIVFFLFGRHVGNHTKDELNLAINCYLEHGSPVIYTCFKRVENPDQTVFDLKEELSNLEQYYAEYSRPEDISFKIHQAIDQIIFSRGMHAPSAAPAPVRRPRTRQETVTVVNSRLAVVRSFIKGAKFDEALPDFRVRYRDRSWGLSTIQYCESGKAQFCVANKNDFAHYCQEHADTDLVAIGSIGFSMGGQNLAVITRADSKYANARIDAIDTALDGAQITIGLTTDRFVGLMTVLGVDKQWFGEHDIELIDIPDPHLKVFDINPNAIVVAGQNLRLEAAETGQFVELFPFRELPRPTQRLLLKNAENILVARHDFLDSHGIDGDELFGDLRRNFDMLAHDDDELDLFVEDLADECKFDSDDPDLREKILRITLYETYRLGMPAIF